MFHDFPFSWEFHHPNWRTHIFQRGRAQPPSSVAWERDSPTKFPEVFSSTNRGAVASLHLGKSESLNRCLLKPSDAHNGFEPWLLSWHWMNIEFYKPLEHFGSWSTFVYWVKAKQRKKWPTSRNDWMFRKCSHGELSGNGHGYVA